MEKNKFYFYVLECSDGSFYGGYTVDLQKRIQAHNTGKGAKYTRSRRPVKCIYYEVFSTKSEAMRAEYQFKRLSRPEKEAYIRRSHE